MPEKLNRDRRFEWACRILLTVHLGIAMSGYISYLQTKYQLTSPLIPPSIIQEIAEPGIYTGLCTGVTFLAALWFYFFRKPLIVMVLSSISILSYEFLPGYFILWRN
jgi:hypothetical protein